MQNSPWIDQNAPTWPGSAPPQPVPPGAQPSPPPYGRTPRPARAFGGPLPLSRVLFGLSEIVRVLLVLIEAVLLVRVVLVFLSANPNAGFSSWIYGLTAPLMTPFFGVFPGTYLAGGMIDVAAILAMIVYWLLARIVEAVLRLLARL